MSTDLQSASLRKNIQNYSSSCEFLLADRLTPNKPQLSIGGSAITVHDRRLAGRISIYGYDEHRSDAV